MRWTRRALWTLAPLLLAAAVAEADETTWSPWAGQAQGVWVTSQESEQWGKNPPSEATVKWVVQTQRPNRTTALQRFVQEGAGWTRRGGALAGAHVVAGVLELESEDEAQAEVGGRRIACTRQTYADEKRRVVLYRGKAPKSAGERVLPQWSESFGWRLPADTVQAECERKEGNQRMLVTLRITGEETLRVGKHRVKCLVEELQWKQAQGNKAGKPLTVTTRWTSSEVPGRVVKEVKRDPARGRTQTRQVTDWGTN